MKRALIAILLMGCGARTGPSVTETIDAGSEVIVAPDASLDTAPAIDTSPSIDVAATCPAERPFPGTPCDDALEGRSCVFGVTCRVECVCERGSFVCASDTCVDRCPDKAPVLQPCAPDEVGRICDYPPFCPKTCRCDRIDGGAQWNCVSPPC